MGTLASLVIAPGLARAGGVTDISDRQELASCKFAGAKAPASKRPSYTAGCQRAASADRETGAFAAAESASFTYENPVFGSSSPDPGALRDSSTDYYAYATGGGFPILKSPDLVHWERSAGPSARAPRGSSSRATGTRGRPASFERLSLPGDDVPRLLLHVLRRPQR